MDCGLLSDPPNGAVELTGTVVGSTATYSCDPGYINVDDTTVVCQNNGNWSGSATCLGNIEVQLMK